MKKLDLLLLKAYIPPFLTSFAIVLFILVNQYLYWFLQAFAGKGLPLKYLGELFFYAAGRLMIMALPVAILTGAVITFGNLAERNELLAVKSSGISFWRLLSPFFGLGMLFMIFSFWQCFEVIPHSSTELYTLLYDVQQKKADLVISPGKFYSDIDNYVIRVGDKDAERNMLYDVILYKEMPNRISQTVIRADSGAMRMVKGKKLMQMTLYDGLEIEEMLPEEKNIKPDEYEFTPQLGRMYFDSLYAYFPLNGFDLEETSPSSFRHQYLLPQSKLGKTIDSMVEKINFLTSEIEKGEKRSILEHRIEKEKERIIPFKFEYYRRFALSVNCLIFMVIGCALGVRIQKGNLGVSAIAGLIAFMTFYIIDSQARIVTFHQLISPIWGAWVSVVFLSPIALLLGIKANKY